MGAAYRGGIGFVEIIVGKMPVDLVARLTQPGAEPRKRAELASKLAEGVGFEPTIQSPV